MFCGLVFRAIVGGEIVPPTQGKQNEEHCKGRKTIYCVDSSNRKVYHIQIFYGIWYNVLWISF